MDSDEILMIYFYKIDEDEFDTEEYKYSIKLWFKNPNIEPIELCGARDRIAAIEKLEEYEKLLKEAYK